MRRSFAVGIVILVLLLAGLLYWGPGTREQVVEKIAEPARAVPETQPVAPEVTNAAAEAEGKILAIENKVEPANEPDGRYLTVHVVSKGTQTPIAGANVRASTSTRSNLTDVLGIARVWLPETDPDRFQLQASREGFSGWLSIWEKSKGEKIPTEHTMVLDPATLIGGNVVDATGRPVPEADVRLGRIWRGNETMDRSNQRLEIRTVSTKTDAAGRWTANHVPEEFLEKIQITVTHPDYARASAMVNAEMLPELRAQTWLVTLKEGARISGLITTTNGEAIAGADVSYGVQYSADRKQTASDAAGRYELRNLALSSFARGQVVTVMAKGFMPGSQNLNKTNVNGELNFTLQAGATIRGRVVNVANEPLKGVRVSREQNSPLEDDGVVWSGQTDSEGRFEWDGAPNSPQAFYFGAGGYAQVRNRKLAPSEIEHLITLEKTRTVKGFVRNDRTRDAIPVFLVMPASGSVERMTRWSSSSEREFKNGAFELALDEKDHSVLRIRALGFLTKMFAIPKDETEPVEAYLTPAKKMEGVVVDANGTPVAGAEIAALGDVSRPSIVLGKGRFNERQTDADKTVSDENGQFKLDVTIDVHFLVGTHPQGGFTQMDSRDFESTHVLRLQPWGRLEGRTVVGQTVVGGQEIMMNLKDGLRTDFQSFRTFSDATGKFAFEFVPPLPVSLVRLEPAGEASWIHRDATNIAAAAGGVTRVDYLLSKTNSPAPRTER